VHLVHFVDDDVKLLRSMHPDRERQLDVSGA
jgi:hypothetical protein